MDLVLYKTAEVVKDFFIQIFWVDKNNWYLPNLYININKFINWVSLRGW